MDASEYQALLRGTAAHEAGHAIVAWMIGLEVETLGVTDEDGSGRSRIECAAHLPTIQRIAVAAAGMEAVELLQAPTLPQAGMSDALKIDARPTRKL
jgi:hypothetical protein